MKITLFKNWDKKLLTVLCRFPVPVIIALVYAVLTALSVRSETFVLGDKFIAFFVTGFFLSLASLLGTEDLLNRRLSQVVAVVLTGLWFVFWVVKPMSFLGDWLFLLAAMSLAAFVLAVFFASYFKKNMSLPFWHFTIDMVLKAAITVLFAGVLMGGLSLAFKAVDVLFNVKLDSKVYEYLAIFCFILFMPVYFLANVPSGDEKKKTSLSINKFLKIFALYIVLPILLLYTVILYAYMLKIVVQWQLPNGWVSWLVSVLGVGGFVTIMLLHPIYVGKKSKPGTFFCRYFPIAILPLLVLMTIGISRRFNDYGLTINRLLVLILNVWMYGVAIYLIVVRAKGIRAIFISFAVIAFLSAVGPWSVCSIARKSITHRIEQTLKNGKLDLSSENTLKLDSATYQNLESALYYMNRTFGYKSVQPFFADSLKSSSFYNMMTKTRTKYGNTRGENRRVYMQADSRSFTTEGFQNAISFSLTSGDSVQAQAKTGGLFLSNNNLKLKRNKQYTILIPLVGEAQKYYILDQENKTFNTDMTTIKGPDYKLVIQQLNATFGKDTVIYRVEGVLLY